MPPPPPDVVILDVGLPESTASGVPPDPGLGRGGVGGVPHLRDDEIVGSRLEMKRTTT